jgi:hypothetical protein
VSDLRIVLLADARRLACRRQQEENQMSENEQGSSFLQQSYDEALRVMQTARTEEELQNAAWKFRSLSDYKDSAQKAQECAVLVENKKKDAIYARAEYELHRDNETSMEKAIFFFSQIAGYRDVDERLTQIYAELEEKRLEEERKAASRRRYLYSNAVDDQDSVYLSSLQSAVDAFTELGDYKDSAERLKICRARLDEMLKQKALDEKAHEANVLRIKRRNRIIRRSILILLFVVLPSIFYINYYIMKPLQYHQAASNAKKGNYVKAFMLFSELGDYRDAMEQAKIYQWAGAQRGDMIVFGTYEQDNLQNGAEPVYWLVLERTEDKIFVIAADALDCRPYHEKSEEVTWENSDLRAWLNGAFLAEAFTKEEQARLLTTEVVTGKNVVYNTEPGIATEDFLFLLSAEEVQKHFPKAPDARILATVRAQAKGLRLDVDGKAWWWLRTPGQEGKYAAIIAYDGEIDFEGQPVETKGRAIRPAMWIRIEVPDDQITDIFKPGVEAADSS